MKVQRSRSVGFATLGCSMVLLSGKFVESSAHVGCINTFLNDGWCDSTNNNEDCNYDNGDCCEDSCVDSQFVCGEKAAYNCIDPMYEEEGHPFQSMSYAFSCHDDLEGNGNCDSANNVEDCDYDGGDCCPDSCVDSDYVCGGNGGFECLDPDYIDEEYPRHSSYSFEFSCDDALAGNGNCDNDNNHEECGYDAGDCCYCTCSTYNTEGYTCGGGSGYNCVDPSASCVNDEDGYVEAGYSTTVGVSANGYDARNGEADGHSGCGEDGCLPELTRDGDTEDDESRWSCSPSLVPYGKSCAITYTFKEEQHIRSVQVAFLKPDDHPRVIYIAADGVDLGHIEASSDTTFNLFGVEEDEISTVTITADDLTADEFIDILEVRILVQEIHHD